MTEFIKHPSMGWLPDRPDFRDYTVDQDTVSPRAEAVGQTESVKAMLAKVGVAEPAKATLPVAADLKGWCSEIEDQRDLGSCTAHAGVGLVEYYERRAFGRHIDASRLFLYKTTRNLLHWTGDTGAFLRSTMGALALFGLPPEEYWEYDVARFDEEPSSFLYSFGQNYRAIAYYRLDPSGTLPYVLLDRIKRHLAAGLPSMFGFTVFSSYVQAGSTGKIPFPVPGDSVVGGHAVMAVGYDNDLLIKNADPRAQATTGALKIRNSWGTGWGDAGYGWLPYEYVNRRLAVDWWTLLSNQWVDTGRFGM
jgi:C1A family cysteine protease